MESERPKYAPNMWIVIEPPASTTCVRTHECARARCASLGPGDAAPRTSDTAYSNAVVRRALDVVRRTVDVVRRTRDVVRYAAHLEELEIDHAVHSVQNDLEEDHHH